MIARAFFLTAVLVALPVFGQDASLGDVRNELGILRNDLQSLRGELVSAGPESYQRAGGDQALDRINAMERQIERLTNQTEKLENRIHRIIEDGTRRIADIEFRLCDVEENCDLAALTTQQLGGQPDIGTGPAYSGPNLPVGGTAASASEQADFDSALSTLNQGQNIRAAEMFAQVAKKHAGGPLTAEALYLRGIALESAGEEKQAAVAWLEGFAVDPHGPRAAESLLGMAHVVAKQGEPTAACLYLAEIPVRFPDQPQAAEAESRMQALNCGASLPADTNQELLHKDDPDSEAEFAADVAAHE